MYISLTTPQKMYIYIWQNCIRVLLLSESVYGQTDRFENHVDCLVVRWQVHYDWEHLVLRHYMHAFWYQAYNSVKMLVVGSYIQPEISVKIVVVHERYTDLFVIKIYNPLSWMKKGFRNLWDVSGKKLFFRFCLCIIKKTIFYEEIFFVYPKF